MASPPPLPSKFRGMTKMPSEGGSGVTEGERVGEGDNCAGERERLRPNSSIGDDIPRSQRRNAADDLGQMPKDACVYPTSPSLRGRAMTSPRGSSGRTGGWGR